MSLFWKILIFDEGMESVDIATNENILLLDEYSKVKLFEYLLHWRFPKVVPMGAIVIRTRYDEGTESAEVATSGCKLYLGHILTYFVSRWKFTFIYFWIMQGRMVNQQPFSHDFVSLNKIIIYDLLRYKEVLNCYINFCFWQVWVQTKWQFRKLVLLFQMKHSEVNQDSEFLLRYIENMI